MNRYIRILLQWQERKIIPALRTGLIAFLPVLFLFCFVLVPGWWAHLRFDLPVGLSRQAGYYTGIPVLSGGFFMYMWTIILFARVRGTQFPVAPTQGLVTRGPYGISRNPMVTSAAIMVLGLGLLLDSWSFVLIGYIPFVLYLIYIKLVEEKELEARFGEDYRLYKKSTPFILPKLFGLKGSGQWKQP